MASINAALSEHTPLLFAERVMDPSMRCVVVNSEKGYLQHGESKEPPHSVRGRSAHLLRPIFFLLALGSLLSLLYGCGISLPTGLPHAPGHPVRGGRRAATDGSGDYNQSKALVPFTFKPLPLGSIKPRGWLLDQMEGLANGLAGHEMDFFPIVQNNTWLGGTTEYSPLNEGYPYWLNGLVPLAYGLDDARLIAQVQNSLAYVLAHQNTSTGWLGPEKTYDSNALWARFPFCLGLMQLAEADPAMVPQIVPALYRFVPLMDSLLQDNKSSKEIWGRARYQDMIITLQWLYEEHPESNGTDQRPMLMQTMNRLRDHGVDWAGYYTQQSYLFMDIDLLGPTVADGDAYFPFLHGVNVGQGLKTMAVDYRFTGNVSLLQTQRDAVNWTFAYHGAASGTVIGDEREIGTAPNRGSELCTVVETMYSLSYAYQVLGDNEFADRAELAAFNALPVMMTPDNWAHQYIAQPNQPWARDLDGAHDLFWNVGPKGTTFGLTPNYPCCTVNHPQGYPKFLANSFVAVGTEGLAHVLLSPSSVSTVLANGAKVTVVADTNYPFSDVLTYTITTSSPMTFSVRIPAWASSPSFTLNQQSVEFGRPSATGMCSISVPAGKHTLIYALASSIKITPRANDTVAIYHGALLYALDVGLSVSSVSASADITGHIAPSAALFAAYVDFANNLTGPSSIPNQARDYTMNNTLPWNFAIDPSSLVWHARNSSDTASQSTDAMYPLANPIWDYHAPKAYMTALGCLLEWNLKAGAPDIPPKNRTCISQPAEVVLRPYGSLKVHMAEFPTIALNPTTS